MNDLANGSSLRAGVALVGSDADDAPAAPDFGGGPLPGATALGARAKVEQPPRPQRMAPAPKRAPVEAEMEAEGRLTDVHVGRRVTLRARRPAHATFVPLGVAAAGFGLGACGWMMLGSAPLAVLSALLGVVGGLLCWVAMHD
jgi:hypothetical protein